MSKLAISDLLALRDKLWGQVRGFPGVITIGIGSKDSRATFVLFVDEKRVHKDDLPDQYSDVPVVIEPANKAVAQG